MSLVVNAGPHAPQDREEPVSLTEAQKRQRRARSLAIAIALGALAVLFYLVTMVKIGSNLLIRPL